MRFPVHAIPHCLLFAVFLFGTSAAAQSTGLFEECDTSGSKATSSTSITEDDDDRRWRISWSNDRCTIEMRAQGKFELEPDLSDVRSMERGAFLEIDVRREGDRRRYEVSREGASLERHYTVNRAEQPIDDEARRWIAAMMLELERRSGFAAPARVGGMLRSGGPNAVMDEVARMSSDHVQARYLSVLLDSARLDETQVRRAIALSADELESDHQQAKFLASLGSRGYVTTAVASDFVKASRSINSDHQKGSALAAVLTLRDLPPAVVGELLSASRTISSDHERAKLLIATADAHGFPDGVARNAYLEAAAGIGSDHQKRSVLSRLAKTDLSNEQLIALLDVAKSISSDHQLAELLVEISTDRTLDGAARDAYLAATEKIGSDHQRRRALTALLGRSTRGTL
jgi:hypothetical protein